MFKDACQINCEFTKLLNTEKVTITVYAKPDNDFDYLGETIYEKECSLGDYRLHWLNYLGDALPLKTEKSKQQKIDSRMATTWSLFRIHRNSHTLKR